MPRRVPRKPRPKKFNVPKGYDSAWEFDMHQSLLKDWKHHYDKIDYIVRHKDKKPYRIMKSKSQREENNVN